MSYHKPQLAEVEAALEGENDIRYQVPARIKTLTKSKHVGNTDVDCTEVFHGNLGWRMILAEIYVTVRQAASLVIIRGRLAKEFDVS